MKYYKAMELELGISLMSYVFLVFDKLLTRNLRNTMQGNVISSRFLLQYKGVRVYLYRLSQKLA